MLKQSALALVFALMALPAVAEPATVSTPSTAAQPTVPSKIQSLYSGGGASYGGAWSGALVCSWRYGHRVCYRRY